MSKEKSMLTKFALWFCVVCVVPLLGVAQETDSGKEQRSVKGRVFDENREPMAGVLVLVQGTTRGVTTGMEGEYDLKLEARDSVLEFSFLGYKTRQIKLVKDRSIVNVNMRPDNFRMEEFHQRRAAHACQLQVLYSLLLQVFADAKGKGIRRTD